MKNLKISMKIFIAFALILAMTVILGVSSLTQVSTLSDVADNYVTISIPATNYLWTARRSVRQMQAAALEATIVMTDAELDRVEEELLEARETFDNALISLEDTVASLDSDVENVRTLMDQVAEIRKRLMIECRKFTTQGNNNAYTIYTDEYSVVFDKVVAAMVTMQNDLNALITQRYNNAHATQRLAVIIVVAVNVAALVVGVGMTFTLSRMLRQPIDEIEAAMKLVANGEFKQVKITYESEDELGGLSNSIRDTVKKLDVITDDIAYLCNELGNGNFAVKSDYANAYTGDYYEILKGIRYIKDTLNTTMTNIDLSSSQVLSGAQQVADGAQGLAQGATEQASSVEELLASINEMQQRVKTNAENALAASKLSNEAGDGVAESNRIMGDLMSAMNEINETSEQISKVIKSIDDIAFQTNILALNAAVEAARAGAAGKGFAVVADEVRSLAGKSAESVKTTTVLIQNTLDAIAKGSTLATSTSESLNAIVSKVSAVNERVAEISEASGVQENAVNQMTIGIEQISAVVQSTSATAEESAAASEELSGQANVLKELIGKFKLDNVGGNSFAAVQHHSSADPFSGPTVSAGDKY